MKSAVFYGTSDIRVEDVQKPAPGPDDVLIRVKYCGVCGTDVHIYNGEKGASDVTPPIILGHEFSGVVEDVGGNVKNIAVGDHVCVDPNVMCGYCYYCHSGMGNFCENMGCVGVSMNGGFAEYSCVNKKAVVKLGSKTPFLAGAMGEPVACCLNGIDMCNIKSGDDVVVFGGGMIGLIMMQLAKVEGAGRVVLVEPVAVKREMGLKLGADIAVDPFNEDVADAIAKHGIKRVAVAIECAGLPSTAKQAIDIAGKKSVAMLFGLTKPDDEISIKPFDIFRKEVEIKASFVNPYTQERAVALIDAGRLDVTSMICEPISLDKLTDALTSDEMRKKGKWVIDPSL